MKRAYNIIDFHSHILPGVDHGSADLEMSLAQLRLMEKAGMDIVVATSHFYPHQEELSAFLQRRNKAAEELGAANDTSVKIALGAEVYCVAGLEETEGLESLTVKGTNTMLLEMPMAYWNSNIIETVLKLNERFDIVLAHIDRYPSHDLLKLLDYGLIAQINTAHSLKGKNKKRVYEWLSEDLVWALGSDIHTADKNAVKAFKKVVRKLGGEADIIFSHTEKLIENAEFI